MKYIKLFENKTHWNHVLHSATWGRPKNSKDNYDVRNDNTWLQKNIIYDNKF
jgi:mRNA-degrading endonuclease HigB of HigAB toxin-antitoxin module